MADVIINKFRASVVRDGSKPASPGFIVSEGQDPVDPAGSGQNHLPVTIATAATGLAITDSQVLGGAGTVGQYIRGDGSLADFPESSGGGSSVSYYLNGSVAQGTIGGVAYKELNKVPILGAGTDFTINADGYIASFITDAGDPNLIEIPGGNWNFETYFSSSSSGGSPTFYVELYKVNSGGTATLIASNSTFPELIAFGTNIISYFSTLAVPTTALALTDRLAIRYYVTHSGRTITLHTEDNHLCQIITTFTTGITALNGLTAQVQNFAVGTSGTDFAIASATATHTFNLPTASATNRGALSSADWTTFNNKTSNLGTVTSVGLSSATSGVTIGSTPVTTSGTITLNIATASGLQNGLLSSSDWTTFNGKQNALTNPVTGTGAAGQVAYFTGTSAISSESALFWDATNDRLGIGLNNPSSLLHIFGAGSGNSLTYTKYTCGDGGDIRVGKESGVNNDAIFGTWSNNSVIFYSNSLPRITIANSGAATFLNNVNQIFNDGGFNFYKSDGTTLKAFIGNLNGTTTDEGYLGLYKTNVQKVAIRASGTSYLDGGNVLIGTQTDNGARLQVSGAASLSLGLKVTGSDLTGTGTGAEVVYSSGSGIFLSFNRAAGVYLPTIVDGLTTTLSTGGTPRFTINSTGAATFSGLITSTIGVNNYLRASNTTTDGLFIENQNNGNISYYGINNSSGSLFFTSSTAYSTNIGTASNRDFHIGTSGAVRLSVTGNGNVLIGTTTDNSHKLRVNGDLWVDGVYKVPVSSYFICGSTGYRFNNSTDAFNNFVAADNGNATLRGTLTQNASDERLKNNIEIIPNAIDKIKQLRGVTFKWNQELYETSRTFDIGVIAQEVEQVLPNAVCLAPFDTNFDDNTSKSGQNYLTVYYEKLIPLLIEGIKELKQEIDTLKN